MNNGLPFQAKGLKSVFISELKLSLMSQALSCVLPILNDLVHRIQILEQNVHLLRSADPQSAQHLEQEVSNSVLRYNDLLHSLLEANVIQIVVPEQPVTMQKLQTQTNVAPVDPVQDEHRVVSIHKDKQ